MQETKDRIIGLADTLIKTKGFNAFSYKDISDPLAIRNAAIHYHFPVKADLGAAVIDQEIAGMEKVMAAWEHLPEDQQLRSLIDSFRQKCQDGKVCLMGSLSPDYDTLPENMQGLLRRFSTTVLDWASQCLEKGRNKGIFHFRGDPYDRALMVVSNLLSSLLLSRVMGATAFDRISTQLLRDLQDK